ncbi:heme uptake protein IsdC [Halalkalibacter oceani]|uniref:heme uptake protein IsdC n=1 Tax=Halalkalibacter oceani TaxID=1653776 RepID=UPI003393F58B
MKQRQMFIARLMIVVMILFLVPAPSSASAALADGTYTAQYTVLKADNDSASMANDYFQKPATLVVENGNINAQITLTKSNWIKSVTVNGAAPSVISSNASADTRTIQFRANDISSPIVSTIHVDIEEMDYDHVYTIRFAFDENSITAVNVADSSGQNESSGSTQADSGAASTASGGGQNPSSEQQGNQAASQVETEEAASGTVIENPKTADNAPIATFVVMLIVSAAALVWMLARKRAVSL